VVDDFVDIVGMPDHAELRFARKVIRSARIDSDDLDAPLETRTSAAI
jgi:hypothetical protein